jgi:hypothetical protein
VDWVHVSQDREQWFSDVNTGIDKRSPETEPLLASQERLLSMELVSCSRDSSVGISTNCKARVRFPGSTRIFSSPRRPYLLWGSSGLLSNGYRRLLPQR